MPLSAGTRLGAYEIVSPLGAGGMGEVYRARDTKLGRSVAIKVLPDAVATHPDRITRFEREAKVLASLNHPHIATLFGMEESAGRHFLVMELVEGQTLAELIASPTASGRGLPVDDALKIALQITGALEAAHECGIIHRDLKPANIKIMPDEIVKVLDFGLAKATAGDRSGQDLSQLPTVSAGGTRAGTILGTAAYMSPEQSSDNTLTSAAVNGEGANFEVGAVRTLFAVRPRPMISLGDYPYDVSTDGQRFLVNTLIEETASAAITLVVNWTAGLKK